MGPTPTGRPSAAPPVVPRPRVGLIAPRYTFFDEDMGDGFAARVRGIADRCVTTLAAHADVVHPGVIETERDARAAREAFRRERLDAVVYAPTMAVPAPLGLTVLEGAPGTPLVIWNCVPVQRMAADLSQAEATENSTTVACLMLANVLLRRGRPAPVVTAPLGDPAALERLLRVIRGAAAAGALRGKLLLRIGEPQETYLNVRSTPEDLARLGVREVSVGADELDDAFTGVDDLSAAAVLDELRAVGWGEPPPGSARAARLAQAIRILVDRHGVVGGTVNCHGPLLRFSSTVGIPACLGVAREALRGVALSCTGDQPAGVALFLARRIAGAALYHETYAPEPSSGLMLVAAGGEGDPAWAEPPGAVAIEANDHYPGRHGEGASVSFALRRGPATMLSMSPVGDTWHLVWATGEIVESRYRHMRGPNGMFRYDAGDATRVSEAWISSGATHHNALAPGRRDVELAAAAEALGVRPVAV